MVVAWLFVDRALVILPKMIEPNRCFTSSLRRSRKLAVVFPKALGARILSSDGQRTIRRVILLLDLFYRIAILMNAAAPNRKRSFSRIKDRVLDRIDEVEPSELNRFKRFGHFLVRLVVMVAHDFIENLVKLQAMALAFKTLLSLAPLLAVVFSILKGFGVHNRLEPTLAEALAPLGEKGEEITHHLIGFVDRMSAGALGSIGLITLFITVLSLMATIEEAFNHIWRVKAPRTFTRRFSDYLSVLLVGPVLVFGALTLTATLQNHSFVQKFLALELFGTVILGLLRLVPYLTLWGAFTFLFLFVPNARVRLRSALLGGLVAAVLWQTVGWGFAVFVASSTRYYAIYSSFAILLLFLIWLHISWVIALLGAQVAYAHQNVQFYGGDKNWLLQSAAGKEKLALHLMLLVGRNFYYGHVAMNVGQLAARLHLSVTGVQEMVEILAQARLLVPLAEDGAYALGRDPETLGVKDILDCVKNAGKAGRHVGGPDDEGRSVEMLLQRVDDAVAAALGDESLKSLMLKLDDPESHAE